MLGYHVSLNREYSRYDVIRTIENALAPHRPRQFTLPGVGYGASGGFPSGKLTELGYATWQWFKLDNAEANLAGDVQYALADFIGCLIDAGPAHSPDDRPYIERFFGTVASSLSSRLPGYTGTNARDIRRALADPKGNLRLYVSLDELEDLIEASLAQYNATPHNGLNGRTPLEAVEHSVRGRGAILNWLPEAKRRTLCLMHTPHTSTVRGYLDQGQRPHINFHGVRYTNTLLASTAAATWARSCACTTRARICAPCGPFADDGAEIGVLKAQGALGRDRARPQAAPGSGSAARTQAPGKRDEPRGPDPVHRRQAGQGQAQPSRCQRADPDPSCAGRRADQRLAAGAAYSIGRAGVVGPTVSDRARQATPTVHPVGLRRQPALNGASP